MIALLEFTKDLVVLVGMSYLYFWRGVSGWWWLLALALIFSGYRPRQ